MKKSRYTRYFKYPLDCLIAAFLILLTSPVLLSTILLLAIANRGSGIFFLQERPGKNGKIFRIIKFKTMNDRKDCRGNFLPDSLRMTPIGKIVRATSVDELPQLFNVLKGDMALIGPRPLLVQYLPLYNEEQARRHEVRPGITGWAQVNGRNAISWKKKFELDIWYVDHVCFMTDMMILKSATKLFSVLLASKRPLITELADKLRLKYPLLPTISPCPTMRLEAIRSIIPISRRRYPKSV